MSLISCPDCGIDVSKRATACPHCGAPIASARIGTALKTEQRTSKRLKLHYVLSIGICITSGMWLMAGLGGQDDPRASTINPVPLLWLFAGAFWFGMTKLRIWWHHK